MSEHYPLYNTLRSAIKNGHLHVIQQILELQPVQLDDEYLDCNLIYIALEEKQIEIAKYLIIEKNFRVQKHDKHLFLTPLHRAIQLGDLQITEILLRKGACINGSCFYCRESFLVMIDKGKSDILSLLLSFTKIQTLNEMLLLSRFVKKNNMEAVKLLLQKDLSTSNERIDKSDAVCITVEEKKFKILSILLSSFDVSNINFDDVNVIAPFFVACTTGYLNVMKHYLDNGFSICTRLMSDPKKWSVLNYCKGYTALHFAAKHIKLETVNFLLDQGADYSLKDENGQTPFHLFIEVVTDEISEISLDMIKLFTNCGANDCSDSHGDKPIHSAFLQRKYHIVDMLLSNISRNSTNKTGLSVFHIACARNSLSLVEKFLEMGIDINACVVKDEFHGYSALHFAAAFNRNKVIKLLLSKNADVHMTNAKGLTPLHIACQYTIEKFCELIQEELKTSACKESRNFLNIAYSEESETSTDSDRSDTSEESSVDTETSSEQNSHNCSDNLDITKENIDWTSGRSNQMEIISTLLDYGSNINCIDNFGNSPVFYIYDLNLEEIIDETENQMKEGLEKELYTRRKVILDMIDKYKPDVEKCYKNSTLLHLFVGKCKDAEKEVILRTLLENGAKSIAKNEEKCSLFHEAITSKSQDAVTILLDYYTEPLEDPLLLHSLLEISIDKNTEKILKLLLDKGVNVNAENKNGWTPLHQLCSTINISSKHSKYIFFELMKSGAEVDCKTSKKRTPLHVATLKTNPIAVKFLLNSGADINIKDKNGKTVICHAYYDLKKRQLSHLDKILYKTLKYLLFHYVKLKTIELPLKRSVKSSASKLSKYCNKISHSRDDSSEYDSWDEDYSESSEEIGCSISHADLDNFSKKCTLEQKRLRALIIDDSTSLFDVIFKSDNEMVKIIRNDIFKEIVKSKKLNVLEEEFEVYGYLIRLQYNKGVMRSTLIDYASQSLKSLASLSIPDLCIEHIFQHLTNNELRQFIRNTSRVYKNEDAIGSSLCFELRKLGSVYSIELENSK